MAQDTLRSVDKVLRLLSLLDGHRTRISVDEARQELSVPRSTLYRLFASLTAHQVLMEAGGGTYCLGPWFIARNNHEVLFSVLKAQTHPLLREISERTGETALLGIRSGAFILYIDRRDSNHTLKALPGLGTPVPLYAGATGKAILAFLDPQEISAIVVDGIARVGPKSPASTRRLLEQLEEIRSNGYARSVEEVYAGVTAIAIPIRSADGRLHGSMSIEAPCDRVKKRDVPRFVSVLREYEPRIAEIFSRMFPLHMSAQATTSRPRRKLERSRAGNVGS